MVHSGALWVSFGFVGFIGARPWGSWVNLGLHSGAAWVLFGKFRRTLGVVVFIEVRWVHTDAPWGSSGSFVNSGAPGSGGVNSDW